MTFSPGTGGACAPLNRAAPAASKLQYDSEAPRRVGPNYSAYSMWASVVSWFFDMMIKIRKRFYRTEIDKSGRIYGRFLVRALSLSVLWWILTHGNALSWLFGAPVIIAVASWRLSSLVEERWSVRPWQLTKFLPFFLWRSFTGSCDVAWRAMHWRMPIAPTIRPFVFRLPLDSPARVVCANCFNMIPGTLVAAWNHDTLHVHILVDGPRPRRELRNIERHIGLVFGLDLSAHAGKAAT